jgi:hypothetical protein
VGQALGEERLPGDERRGDQVVVVGVRAGGDERRLQVPGGQLERLSLGVGGPQRRGEGLRAGRPLAQSRFTAAAAARITMMAPYPM